MDRKEYMKAYRLSHKEQSKEYRKKWREAHKDDDETKQKNNEYSRIYYNKTKKQVTSENTQETT